MTMRDSVVKIMARPALARSSIVAMSLFIAGVPACLASDDVVALKALAKQLAASRSQLKSWKGVYRLKQMSMTRDPEIQLNAAKPQPTAAGELNPIPDFRGVYYRTEEATVEFCVDALSGNFRAHWKSTEPVTYRDLETDEILVDRGVAPDVVSVWNKSEYMWLDSAEQDTVVESNALNVPAAAKSKSVKRIAYRNRSEAGIRRMEYGRCFAPLRLYELGGRTPEEGIMKAVHLLEEGKSPPLKFFRAVDDRGILTLERTFSSSNELRPNLTVVERYREISDEFAVVEQVRMYFGVENDTANVQKEWNWKSVEGVFIPFAWRDRRYDSVAKRITFDRTVELVECDVNHEIDNHILGAGGLGLKNGDILRNLQTQEDLVQTASGLKTPSDIRLALPVDDKPKGGRTGTFLFINALLLAVIAVVLIVKANRSRRHHG